jgi:hypothetical protein
MNAPDGSDDAIEKAWREYHGPVDDGDGEPYVPTMPPAFRRGFVDGFEYAERLLLSVGNLRKLAGCDHDAAWEKYFILPLAKFMHERGIRHIEIVVDNGKVTFVLDPVRNSSEKPHAN